MNFSFPEWTLTSDERVATGHGSLSLQKLVICCELYVQLFDDLLEVDPLLRGHLVSEGGRWRGRERESVCVCVCEGVLLTLLKQLKFYYDIKPAQAG